MAVGKRRWGAHLSSVLQRCYNDNNGNCNPIQGSCTDRIRRYNSNWRHFITFVTAQNQYLQQAHTIWHKSFEQYGSQSMSVYLNNLWRHDFNRI